MSYRILDYKGLQSLRDPEWLVDGIIPTGEGGSLGMLFGKWGSAKSFVALDMAHSIATGIDWHGRPTVKGRVAYVVAEGALGFKYRAAAWARHHGFNAGIPRMHYVTDPVDLMDMRRVELLLDTLQSDTPGLPDLTIIDTLARSMPSGDENETKDMNAVVAGLGRIQAVTRGSVLVVHHQGHNEETQRARGSSVLPGACDYILSCAKTGNRVAVECRKQKDAEEFAPLHFELKPVAGSCVIETASNLLSMKVR